MIKFVKSFAKNESGATAIEYGLIAALIAVALITVLSALSTKLNGTFTKVSDSMPQAAAPATPTTTTP